MTAAAVAPTINRGVALAVDVSATSSATAATLIVTTSRDPDNHDLDNRGLAGTSLHTVGPDLGSLVGSHQTVGPDPGSLGFENYRSRVGWSLGWRPEFGEDS